MPQSRVYGVSSDTIPFFAQLHSAEDNVVGEAIRDIVSFAWTDTFSNIRENLIPSLYSSDSIAEAKFSSYVVYDPVLSVIK